MAGYSRNSRSRRRAAGKGGAVQGYTLRDRQGRVRYVGVSGDPRRSRRRTGGTVQGYSLRDRKGRPTYFGVTNDPGRRAAEHKRDGKRGKLKVETRPMSRGYARSWEKRKLARHRKTHRGRNPDHNQTRSGGWKS